MGHFRLDYRDELGDKLGLIQSELEKTPDSVLMMMAYQKWKEKCVDHLEGDWAFVIHSKKENKISLFKDKMGISALFYYKVNNQFLFASSAASIQDIKKINFEIDKIQLCRKSIYGLSLRNGYTLIENLFFLKFGYFLHVNNNLDLLENKYWQLETLTLITYSFEEDYAFEMHSKFSLAVKSRMVTDSKSGLFLSSGLDSTAVASYLSTNLELNHKSLHTYTSYPYNTNIIQESKLNMIDETKLVKEFTNSYPAIIPEYLNFPKTDIIEMIHNCYDGHPDFMELNINTFWMNGIFEKAKNDKVKIIFSGQMGNYVITWYEQYKLLNIFFKARFISLIEEIVRLAKVQEKNFFMIIKSEILSEFFYRVIINFKNIFSRPSKIFKPYLVRSGIISKDSWGKELKEIMFIPDVTYYKNYSSRVVRKIVFSRSNTTTGLSWYRSGHLHAINCVDPTRDERLVNYAFSIPEAIYSLFGQKKYIYKLWMKYKIPDQILNATVKSFQSADISFRISSKKNFDSLMHKIKLELASTRMIDQKHFENLVYRFSRNKNLMKKRLVLAEMLSIVSIVSLMKNKKV